MGGGEGGDGGGVCDCGGASTIEKNAIISSIWATRISKNPTRMIVKAAPIRNSSAAVLNILMLSFSAIVV